MCNNPVGKMLLLIFWVFLVYNLIKFPYFVYMNYSATHWIKSEAELVNVVRQPKKASVRYSYVYENTVYFGDKVSFFINGVTQASYFNKKKEGDSIKIYINPKQPEQSVVFIHTIKEIIYDAITRLFMTFGFLWGYYVSKEHYEKIAK